MARAAAPPLLLLAYVAWRFREGALLRVVYSHGDIGSEFAPLKMATAVLLRQGLQPLWAPQVLGGYPIAANPHAGLFHPLSWLLAALLPPAGVVNYFAIASFALAALGTYAYLRDLEVARPAAATGGLIFALNGNRLFESYVFIGSVAFFPLLVRSLRRAVRGGHPRDFAWASLWSGLTWLGGNPQMGYILNGSALIYGGLELLCRRRGPPGPGRWRAALGLAVAAALGLGLAAAQLAPTLELVQATPRASPVWETMVAGSLEPQSLIDVVRERHLLYLGLLPVSLAIAGLSLAGRRREAAALGILGVLFLLLSLGNHTPVYRLLYDTVPGFALFRIPMRYFVVVTFVVSALAALALDAFARAMARRGRRTAMAGGLVVALLALAIAGDYARLPRYHYDPGAAVSPQALAARRGAVEYLERHATGFRVLPLVARTTILSPFDQKLRDLEGSAPLLTAVESLDGYMPLHYLPYMTVYLGVFSWPAAARDRLLDFLNGGYVVTDAEYPSGFTPGTLVHEWTTPDGLRIFRNPDALPRALLVPRAEGDDDVAGRLARLASGEWDPRAVAQVPSGTALDLACALPFAGTARLVGRSPQRLAVEVETSCPALLWLLELYYPGWGAEVDGRPVPVLPTNLMYRGVRVPAGRHRVELRYAPVSWRAGAAISMLALAVVVAALAWRR